MMCALFFSCDGLSTDLSDNDDSSVFLPATFTYYTSDGVEFSSINYYYNSDNQLSRYEQTNTALSYTFISKYTYNSDGKIDTITKYKDSTEVGNITYEYLANGNIKKTTYDDTSGKSYVAEEYNSDGKLSQTTLTYDASEQETVTKYTYMSNGNVQINYYSNGTLQPQKLIQEYSDGNLTKTSTYDADGNLSQKTTIEYSEGKKTKTYTYMADETLYIYGLYEY